VRRAPGVLYVDEVNLLHDHLVDLLLDAAAMGRAYVEREGISVSHAASFLLVGTMNPEEGELRPQLLDRFGLTVEVHADRDVNTRAEVIRRRLAFESDQAGSPPHGPHRTPSWPLGSSPRAAPCRPCGCPIWSCAGSPRCARPLTWTACGPTWWWPAPPSPMPPGAAPTRSTSTTSRWPPGWPCRTAGAGIP